MKTTLDLPDDLLQDVALRAAQDGLEIKETMARLIRKGLASEPVALAAGSVERDRLLEAAIKKVRGFGELAEDWDSYGGRAASPQAIDVAVSLLRSLRTFPQIALPTVSPISAGVYFEWVLGELEVYIEIYADSLLAVERENGEIVESIESSPHEDIGPILKMLKHFYGQSR